MSRDDAYITWKSGVVVYSYSSFWMSSLYTGITSIAINDEKRFKIQGFPVI
jgi:hypothetical protein